MDAEAEWGAKGRQGEREMAKTVIQLVAAGLYSGGYDGLVVPGVCGCLNGDLSPADCISKACLAAYKHKHSIREGDWILSTEQNGVTDMDIEKTIGDSG